MIRFRLAKLMRLKTKNWGLSTRLYVLVQQNIFPDLFCCKHLQKSFQKHNPVGTVHVYELANYFFLHTLQRCLMMISSCLQCFDEVKCLDQPCLFSSQLGVTKQLCKWETSFIAGKLQSAKISGKFTIHCFQMQNSLKLLRRR